MKYLFKYIYKGHDRESVAVRESDKEDEKGNIDEIKQYRDARWVTPPEALWRIYGFDLSKVHPPVKQLQLHLPDMHMVSFHQRQKLKDVVNRPGVEQSMLTAYFEANRLHEKARGILYHDFPVGNLMESSGSGENIKTVAKLVELSGLIRLKVNATIFVFS